MTLNCRQIRQARRRQNEDRPESRHRRRGMISPALTRGAFCRLLRQYGRHRGPAAATAEVSRHQPHRLARLTCLPLLPTLSEEPRLCSFGHGCVGPWMRRVAAEAAEAAGAGAGAAGAGGLPGAGPAPGAAPAKVAGWSAGHLPELPHCQGGSRDGWLWRALHKGERRGSGRDRGRGRGRGRGRLRYITLHPTISYQNRRGRSM